MAASKAYDHAMPAQTYKRRKQRYERYVTSIVWPYDADYVTWGTIASSVCTTFTTPKHYELLKAYIRHATINTEPMCAFEQWRYCRQWKAQLQTPPATDASVPEKSAYFDVALRASRCYDKECDKQLDQILQSMTENNGQVAKIVAGMRLNHDAMCNEGNMYYALARANFGSL